MSTDPLAQELEPVFLELGKALFTCQVFESTLVFMLSMLSHEDSGMEEGAFRAAIDLFSEKTLGQLLKAIRARLEPPEQLNEYFAAGWNSRNWIVHQFVHHTAEQLQSPGGRIEAVNRLATAKHTVKLADVLANRVLDQLLKKYGLSVAALKANADRVWEHLNPPPPEAKQ